MRNTKHILEIRPVSYTFYSADMKQNPKVWKTQRN